LWVPLLKLSIYLMHNNSQVFIKLCSGQQFKVSTISYRTLAIHVSVLAVNLHGQFWSNGDSYQDSRTWVFFTTDPIRSLKGGFLKTWHIWEICSGALTPIFQKIKCLAQQIWNLSGIMVILCHISSLDIWINILKNNWLFPTLIYCSISVIKSVTDVIKSILLPIYLTSTILQSPGTRS